MPLFTNQVSFRQPAFDVLINLGCSVETKVMDLVSGRNRVHTTESRVVYFPRQHNMAVYPLGARGKLRERHPDLKGNTGFFRIDDYRPKALDGLQDSLKDRADFSRLPGEMAFQIVSAAEMGLVSVRKPSLTLWALPEWLFDSFGHQWSIPTPAFNSED